MEQLYDLIILGSGCAGLTAGIYAGRAQLRTLILESGAVGGQAATTNEIGNYPGVPDADGPDFDGHLVDYDDAMRRGVKEAVGTLIVEFGSYGKAPLVEPATLEDMAARYAKEG